MFTSSSLFSSILWKSQSDQVMKQVAQDLRFTQKLVAAFTRATAWLDADTTSADREMKPRFELDRCIPFIFLHAGCLGVFIVGTSEIAVWVCIALYFVRMFAITGFYHRYFSHRTFKTSRFAQFLFAALGSASVQRGPLWWAAHHRVHHRESDKEGDVHSPISRSFMWSHLGWLTSSRNMLTDYSQVKDFADFPELRFLNRFDWLVPALLWIALYVSGEYLRMHYPAYNTSGAQLVIWGFFVSTVILFHGTSSINSICHIFGSRRYETEDNSKNNFLFSLVTLGEGWHNNHHHYMNCARQGFFWWEIDITYYGLCLLERLGIISDLKPLPEKKKFEFQSKSKRDARNG